MAVRAIDDYYDTFTADDFISQGSGVYTLTIPADYHGLQSGFRVSKIVKTNADGSQNPVLVDYVIAANGDLIITVNERFDGRFYLSNGG